MHAMPRGGPRAASHPTPSPAHVPSLSFVPLLSPTSCLSLSSLSYLLGLHRPQALEVQEAFAAVYKICRLVERDQFLVPYFFRKMTRLFVSTSLTHDLAVQQWNHRVPHSSNN